MARMLPERPGHHVEVVGQRFGEVGKAARQSLDFGFILKEMSGGGDLSLHVLSRAAGVVIEQPDFVQLILPQKLRQRLDGLCVSAQFVGLADVTDSGRFLQPAARRLLGMNASDLGWWWCRWPWWRSWARRTLG